MTNSTVAQQTFRHPTTRHGVSSYLGPPRSSVPDEGQFGPSFDRGGGVSLVGGISDVWVLRVKTRRPGLFSTLLPSSVCVFLPVGT